MGDPNELLKLQAVIHAMGGVRFNDRIRELAPLLKQRAMRQSTMQSSGMRSRAMSTLTDMEGVRRSVSYSISKLSRVSTAHRASTRMARMSQRSARKVHPSTKDS